MSDNANDNKELFEDRQELASSSDERSLLEEKPFPSPETLSPLLEDENLPTSGRPISKRFEDTLREVGEYSEEVGEEDSDPSFDWEPKGEWLGGEGASIKSLTGMYRNWFLDYASYVILERAIPHIEDGLKPVQRRVLHAMSLLENGHLHKVAKIVGQTMAFHPHGDASINDALVQLGQKSLLIDTQGNWGNIFTGDAAAAGRYIEAKLSSFALETVFDDKITKVKRSYDGTADEPISLPVRFPLLLVLGAEGIAVGLSSKIYPHNPQELIAASIAHLRGESFTLYPDFRTGGLLDVERYNDGMRGGMLKCRAKIERIADRQISITELPYGKTTSSLIDSILKANEKGQIKIKRADDMTAAETDIRLQLPAGVSTDKTIDGLYAFTDCEVSLSPNACVIKEDKPIFIGVSDLLRYSTDRTKAHFDAQLHYRLDELRAAHLSASLEQIFIEERIYKDREFEEASNETEALNHVKERILAVEGITFIAPIKKEDLKRLLEIRMARILRFNRDKHDKQIARLEREIEEVEANLRNIVGYTIAYFEKLRDEYFSKAIRRTVITRFSNIEATKVIEATEKLYLDRAGGFAGTGLKNAEFVANCSSLDDMIVFFRDGNYLVTKIEDKKFLGKGEVIHIDRYVRDNKRTIFNAIYRDGKQGSYFIKRFFVTGITRDRKYDLTYGTGGSEVIYFTANPNGEAETVRITLKPRLRLRILVFEKDFSEVPIRGRSAKGNLITKAAVQRITLKEKGASTLGGRKVWFDRDVLRINFESRGDYLGEFNAHDRLLAIRSDGTYYTIEVSESGHFSPNIMRIECFDRNKQWSAIYRHRETGALYLKRFTLNEQAKPTVLQGEGNDLVALSDREEAIFRVLFEGASTHSGEERIEAASFVGVKSVNAKGKRITTRPVREVKDITPELEVYAPPLLEEALPDVEAANIEDSFCES